ncbi:hypothetical protein PGTUg99_033201 [Puccinia graminis f. sp. tritici]|uniref:Uncharacterized protein n=1 Tax=Puccinia graminis f. sp. tritici TaxID=56615 RepID=A0A5B0MG45_PUCGR|nr:hypothetical protein PGTUg99_033201 [Puccinia graminis f. sp. tritici]
MNLDILDYLQDPHKSQESPPEPSQHPYKGLFIEEEDVQPVQSQLLVDSSGLEAGSDSRNGPSAKSRKRAAATKALNIEPTLLISLEYCLFIHNHNPHIPDKQHTTSNLKSEWDKIVSNKHDLPQLNTNLMERHWDDLQNEIIWVIGCGKKHLKT